MEVSFYLRSELKNKDGSMPVRMHITVGGALIKKSLKKVKVHKEHWKVDKQRVKPNTKNEEYNYHVEYNKILDEWTEKVRVIQRNALLNNINLTKEYVLKKLEEKVTVSTEYDFFETFNEFTAISRGSISKRTIIGYNTVRNFLKDFQDSTNCKLSMQEFDISTFDSLKSYAFEERGVLNNYFAKITNVLKRFLSWTYDRQYHTNLVFKKFSAPEDQIEVVFLTIDELFKLYNHSFESSKLEKVRDSFCFACFTGLRFSDLYNLKSSNIFEDYIKLNVKKTKEIDHIIPLNKYSKDILNKYKSTQYEPIPAISSQKFNEYLKKCCELAKIDTPIEITRYSGSNRIDLTLPKYKLIASHAGRRTFATNSLILGMDERVVRTITGHKKEASFNKYVNIANDHKKKQMENSWDKL